VFWKPKLIEFPSNARRLDKLNLAMEKVDEFLETSTYIYIYIYNLLSFCWKEKDNITLPGAM
jgi:hypothetical protein